MPLPTLLPRSASSATAASTSCLLRRLPLQLFLLPMCSTSTCIADPLRRFWLMRTPSRTRIAGTLIRPGARSLARSWRNGRQSGGLRRGTCAWNWGRSFLPHSYTSRNLPKLSPRRGPWPASHLLPSKRHLHHPLSMALPNGHVLPGPLALLAPLFLCKPMGHCVARQIVPFTHKSADPNAMAPFASCMPLASVIVAIVPYESSVKSPPRASSHDGSAPCSGLSNLSCQRLLLLCRPLHKPFLSSRCSGKTGLAVASDVPGSNLSVVKRLA